MLEAAITFLSKVAGGFTTRLIGGFIERFKRPKVAKKRAPENLFEQLCPGVSLDRMKELLGAPHREIDGRQFSYSFSDALVQVRSADRKSIRSVAVALPTIHKKASFPIYPTSFVLGRLRLNEVLAEGAEIKKNSSTKHWGFWIQNYYGFTGLYRYYTFGVLEAPCLSCPNFEWDHDKDTLKSDPKNIVINWASVSGNKDEGEELDFWAFV
jgi:hypothetical protein